MYAFPVGGCDGMSVSPVGMARALRSTALESPAGIGGRVNLTHAISCGLRVPFLTRCYMATAHYSKALKRFRSQGGTWEFRRDADGRWRWQRIDIDGNVVGSSPHSYRHLLECVSNAQAEGYSPASNSRFVSWPA
jgi:hypothetical protein